MPFILYSQNIDQQYFSFYKMLKAFINHFKIINKSEIVFQRQ